MHTHKKLAGIFFTVLLALSIPTTGRGQEKLKTEDVISRHLSAIGSTEARSATKSIIAVGDAKALTHSTALPEIFGVSQVASEGEKVVLAMVFNSTSYPYEKAGYDGSKMTVALLKTTGGRSALIDFLASQQAIFKEGLIGGTLSSAWPLLDAAAKDAKMSYGGTKKINDRLLHEVKYSTRKSDMKVSLFFDAETFQHVRTEYSYSTSARMGARPSSGPIASMGTGSTSAAGTDTGSSTLNRYKLIEEFSDFKPTGGQLTLPHTYKLRLTVDAQRTLLLEWVMNFKQFTFNEKIDESVFNVSTAR